MILKIISLLLNRKIVLLQDFQGEMYRTLEMKKRNPFTGNRCCYVYFFTKIGFVDLLEDGKTENVSFIEYWKYENKTS